MAWIEPKTDWVSSDYFNIEDYNRIVGNIKHLINLAYELYEYYEPVMMTDTKDYTSMIYATDLNAIEENIERLVEKTYGDIVNVGETIFYAHTGPTPLWSEFNRIESACLLLYNTMTAHKDALPRLAFTLGGQKGMRI